MHSSANWEEPDVFNPERFLEKDAEVAIARRACQEIYSGAEPHYRGNCAMVANDEDTSLSERYEKLSPLQLVWILATMPMVELRATTL
jgi:hypothetical protein